jgi:hypothetical protein
MKNGYSVDNCKNEDERRWWENWENMARANTWTASNTIFDSPKVLISGEIDEDFKKMACFVVAESHLEAAMKKSPTEIEVGYKQHHLEYVAGILRDMRDLRLPIRDSYYNYLVDILCR